MEFLKDQNALALISIELYITSNIPLDQQYPEIQKCKMETWHAFLRRINTVTEFRRDGLIREVHYESNENP